MYWVGGGGAIGAWRLGWVGLLLSNLKEVAGLKVLVIVRAVFKE